MEKERVRISDIADELGHKRILCIADNHICMDWERYEGFQAGFGTDGVDFMEIPLTQRERMAFYQQNVERLKSYTAIFAVSNFYAIELMQFLMEQNIRVPEDISIAGFDDAPICKQVHPTLTTVRQDERERARLAIEKLKRLKDNVDEGTEIEKETARIATSYLKILALTFLPMAGSTLLSTLLRCRGKAVYPFYASIAVAFVNTGLNYVLIFGKLGFPVLGVKGAALATVIAQLVNFLLIFIMYQKHKNLMEIEVDGVSLPNKAFHVRQYIAMLFPIMINEFLWSLGENIYAMIYGKMGTQSCAAFVWKFSIPYVYLMLSLEECIRFGISLIIFQKRS